MNKNSDLIHGIHAVDHCGSQLKDHRLAAIGAQPAATVRGQGEPAATQHNDQGRPLP